MLVAIKETKDVGSKHIEVIKRVSFVLNCFLRSNTITTKYKNDIAITIMRGTVEYIIMEELYNVEINNTFRLTSAIESIISLPLKDTLALFAF